MEKPCFYPCLAFWCVGIFLGGFLTFAEGLFKKRFASPYMIIPLIILCITAGAVFRIIQRKIHTNCTVEFIEADIRFGNKQGNFTLLVDSGNLAFEPTTGKRIIIIGNRAAKRLYIPKTAEKYAVNLKCTTGHTTAFAYAPDEIKFKLANTCGEEFLVMKNSACDDFAGFDGLAPTIKTR